MSSAAALVMVHSAVSTSPEAGAASDPAPAPGATEMRPLEPAPPISAGAAPALGHEDPRSSPAGAAIQDEGAPRVPEQEPNTLRTAPTAPSEVAGLVGPPAPIETAQRTPPDEPHDGANACTQAPDASPEVAISAPEAPTLPVVIAPCPPDVPAEGTSQGHDLTAAAPQALLPAASSEAAVQDLPAPSPPGVLAAEAPAISAASADKGEADAAVIDGASAQAIAPASAIGDEPQAPIAPPVAEDRAHQDAPTAAAHRPYDETGRALTKVRPGRLLASPFETPVTGADALDPYAHPRESSEDPSITGSQPRIEDSAFPTATAIDVPDDAQADLIAAPEAPQPEIAAAPPSVPEIALQESQPALSDTAMRDLPGHAEEGKLHGTVALDAGEADTGLQSASEDRITRAPAVPDDAPRPPLADASAIAAAQASARAVASGAPLAPPAASAAPPPLAHAAIDQPSQALEPPPARAPRSRAAWSGRLRRAAVVLAALGVGYVVLILSLIVAYRWVDPPRSALMITTRLSGQPILYAPVPITRISSYLQRAVVTSEDARFCQHPGVDWGALFEAMNEARGGSTITMQTAKNLFLWPSRSYVRKAIEIPVALAIDAFWPKRRILEVYLNIAEWGPGIFGAEAAAHYHFNKPAARLTAREASLLAAALPNPIARDAGEPGRLTALLAARLRGRMANSDAFVQCLGLRPLPRAERKARPKTAPKTTQSKATPKSMARPAPEPRPAPKSIQQPWQTTTEPAFNPWQN